MAFGDPIAAMSDVTRREARALRARVAAVALTAFVPMLIALLLVYRDEVAWQQEIAEAWLTEHVQRSAAGYAESFADAEALLWAFAHSAEVAAAPDPACDTLAGELTRRGSHISNVAVVDAEGEPLCSAFPIGVAAGTPNAADRQFFVRAMASRGVEVGDLVRGRVTGEPSVHLAYALRDPDGTATRVAFAAVQLDLLDPGQLPLLPESGVLLLVGDEGRVLWRYPEPEQWVGTSLPDGALRDLALETTPGIMRAQSLDGVWRHFATSPVQLDHAGHAVLLLGVPSELLTARARSHLVRNLLAVLLMGGLGVAAALFIGDRWIVRRAGALASAMRRLGEGDLTARIGNDRGGLERELDQMAAALDERTRENRLLLRSVGYALLGTDREGRIVLANPVAERLLGRALDDLRGHTLHEVLHGADADHPLDACPMHLPLVDGRSVSELQHTLVTPDGPAPVTYAATPMEDRGEIHGVGLVIEDLRTRRRLDEAEREGRKLEVVERLAGGVAHDFNNLLAIMLGYTATVRARVPPGSAEDADLEQVVIAGERASALTRRLLAFSRRQAGEARLLGLDEAVQDAATVIRRLMGEAIAVSVETSAPSCRLLADPHRVEQVLLNLALNAQDAMPSGGRLAIRTAPSQRRPGGALLVVSDTGVGVPPDVRASLFEPFVTTKPRGTGLGLAIVREYVEELGGTIRVDSAPEHGSRFEIDLPCTE